MNRCIRDPYVQWCERFSPSAMAGGATYSIELNPPSRIAFNTAFLKVPDSFYNSKLFTTKISDYEKEIGFNYC